MKTIVGLFGQLSDADHAVSALEKAGFTQSDYSVLAQDHLIKRGENGRSGQGDDIRSGEDVSAGEGAGVGAAGGAVVGAVTGLLMGLGALAIPGVGPVIAAGTLATGLASSVAGGAIVGVTAGAATGGLVASLVDMGISDNEANFYAEGVKRGGVLITVQTDETRASKAESILRRFNALEVNTHTEAWQAEGWERFDETISPSKEHSLSRVAI